MTDDVAARLVDYIGSELSKIDEPIEPDTDLLLSGALDSLGVMAVTAWMEDELGVVVDPMDVVLENFQTVDLMVAFLANQNRST